MSTDLATRDPAPDNAVALLASASLADWVLDLDQAHKLAVVLCKTSFVPKHFFGKPDETAAAILTGREVGLSPLASLRAIFVFNGVPGMYAKTMVAVLVSQGHQVWVEEQSDERVVVSGRRKGTDRIITTVWDRDRVVKAKLTSNAKYQETPQQMMAARGQAEVCRLVAPDALLGLPYSVEELEDMPPAYQAGPATVGPRVTASEILAPAPLTSPSEPSAPNGTNATADSNVAAQGPATITSPQQKKLHALLTEKGLSDRDQALGWISDLIGRVIDTTKVLTKAEAGHVIDQLEQMRNAVPAEAPASATTPAPAGELDLTPAQAAARRRALADTEPEGGAG